jgi:hypothetical protein
LDQRGTCKVSKDLIKEETLETVMIIHMMKTTNKMQQILQQPIVRLTPSRFLRSLPMPTASVPALAKI